MSRIAYVNGCYVPHAQAAIHIEDRGFQFADGVYEVCEVYQGHLIDETRHMERLKRSLREIQIAMPVTERSLSFILRETMRRNHVRDGLVYLQITRGSARRDHVFPGAETPPSIIVTARANQRSKGEALAARGIAVITTPDIRWARVDIKTTALLPNALARQEAKKAGAREAWFVDREGCVTEGAATNAWIVTKGGVLVTRPAEFGILRGVTRTTLFDVAEKLGLSIEERAFTVAEALDASEAFITAATTLVMPVIRIDGHPVGNGRPGPVAKKLRADFHKFAEAR